MQPQQPYYGPPPANQNYDFIINPGSPPTRKLKLLGGGSLIKKVIFIAMLLIVLLIVFSVAKSLLTKSTVDLPTLQAVADTQQEILMLSTSFGSSTSNVPTMDTVSQNFAVTAQLTMKTEQAALDNYLAANHAKLNPKLLMSVNDGAADSELTTAAGNNTFDVAFSSVMRSQLQIYEQNLTAAYNKSTGLHGKTLLKSDYQQTLLLVKLLSAPEN